MQSARLEDLRPVRLGILASLLAILLGFALGSAFGAFEDAIKEGLREDARAVLAEKYAGDEAQAKAVTDKAWSYHKRAHMHWGGIGAATLAISLLLGLVGGSDRMRGWLSIALGVGALAYPLAWLLAGRAAPSLGSTGAAKAAYELVFVVPAGLLLLAVLASLFFVAARLFRRET